MSTMLSGLLVGSGGASVGLAEGVQQVAGRAESPAGA
jgi:hypothetical protein